MTPTRSPFASSACAGFERDRAARRRRSRARRRPPCRRPAWRRSRVSSLQYFGSRTRPGRSLLVLKTVAVTWSALSLSSDRPRLQPASAIMARAGAAIFRFMGRNPFRDRGATGACAAPFDGPWGRSLGPIARPVNRNPGKSDVRGRSSLRDNDRDDERSEFTRTRSPAIEARHLEGSRTMSQSIHRRRFLGDVGSRPGDPGDRGPDPQHGPGRRPAVTSDEIATKAATFLKSRQKADGSWSSERGPGITGLVVTALLRARSEPRPPSRPSPGAWPTSKASSPPRAAAWPRGRTRTTSPRSP